MGVNLEMIKPTKSSLLCYVLSKERGNKKPSKKTQVQNRISNGRLSKK